MHPNSRQKSPVEGHIPQHTFSRGNCSAYGAAAKKNENWTTISDRAERRRVQNRIAQRAYRQKLKERLQLLESRAAALSSSSSSTSLNAFNDEACYLHTSSNVSTPSDEQCRRYPQSHATSRHTTASPPTSYSNHPACLSHSPNMQDQRLDMMPFYQDMQQQYSVYHTSTPLEISTSFPTEAPQDLGLNFPYLQTLVDIPMSKFGNDELPSLFPTY